MKCQKCGYEVDASMKFCPICGSEVTYVQQNPVVKKCSKCGIELEEGIRFCPNCGQGTEQVQKNMRNPQTAVEQVRNSEPVMNTAQGSVQNAAMRNSGQGNVQNAAMRNSEQGKAYMAQAGDLPIENAKENGQTLCFQRRDRIRSLKSRKTKTTVVISENDIKINKIFIKLLSKTEEKVFAKSEVASANLRTAMDTGEMVLAGFFIAFGFLWLICAIVSGSTEGAFGGLLWFPLGAWYFWSSYGQAIDIKSVTGETYSILFDGGKHKQEAQFLLNVCNRFKRPQA